MHCICCIHYHALYALHTHHTVHALHPFKLHTWYTGISENTITYIVASHTPLHTSLHKSLHYARLFFIALRCTTLQWNTIYLELQTCTNKCSINIFLFISVKRADFDQTSGNWSNVRKSDIKRWLVLDDIHGSDLEPFWQEDPRLVRWPRPSAHPPVWMHHCPSGQCVRACSPGTSWRIGRMAWRETRLDRALLDVWWSACPVVVSTVCTLNPCN